MKDQDRVILKSQPFLRWSRYAGISFIIQYKSYKAILRTRKRNLKQEKIKRDFSLFKGELNPKIDFLSFEHLDIVEQLYEDFLSC